MEVIEIVRRIAINQDRLDLHELVRGGKVLILSKYHALPPLHHSQHARLLHVPLSGTILLESAHLSVAVHLVTTLSIPV